MKNIIHIRIGRTLTLACGKIWSDTHVAGERHYADGLSSVRLYMKNGDYVRVTDYRAAPFSLCEDCAEKIDLVELDEVIL